MLSSRYALGALWLLAQRGVCFPLNLAMSIYVARYIGVENFGALSFSQTIVGVFAMFAALGTEEILVKELVRHSSARSDVVKTTLYIRLTSASVAVAMMALVCILIDLSEQEKIMMAVMSVSILFQITGIFRNVFEAGVFSKYIAITLYIQTLVSAGLKLFLIMIGSSPVWFAFSFTIDSFVVSLALIVMFYKKLYNTEYFKGSYSHEIAIRILRSALPMLLSGFSLFIYMKIDSIMIRFLIDLTAAGHYAAAVRVSESWLIFAYIVSSTLFPAIISAQKHSFELFNSRMKAFYSLMFWVPILLAIVVSSFSNEIIHLLYGPEYAASAPVLSVHAWSGICIFVITASAKWFLSQNLEKSVLYRSIFGACVNIVLNFILIPTFGIVGAAYATLISYFAMAFVYDLIDINARNSLSLKLNSITWPFSKIYNVIKNVF